MSSEKVKYFYEEIKLITEGISKTDLSEKLIEAAKEQDLEKMKSISRQFKKDNLELWGRMSLFYKEYCEEGLHIFYYEMEYDGLYPYNPEEIDPRNLIVLMALSESCLDETDLFANWRDFKFCLSNRGYKEIAMQMELTSISDLEDLMAA